MGRKPRYRYWKRSTGQRISIFIGGFGNNITKPAETTATQFVVIEDVAVTPSAFNSATATADYRGLGTSNGVKSQEHSFKSVSTQPTISLTPTMLETMVFREPLPIPSFS